MRAVGGDDGKRRLLVELAQFAGDVVASQSAADDDDWIHEFSGGVTLSTMQRPAKAMPHCTAPYHAASSTISKHPNWSQPRALTLSLPAPCRRALHCARVRWLGAAGNLFATRARRGVRAAAN